MKRRTRGAALAASFTCALFALPAWAADGPAPVPAELGVRVEKPAGDGVHYQQGSGVYLGGGRVLTAQHVIKLDPQHKDVTVLLDGVRDPATVSAVGTRRRDPVDLALIALAPSAPILPARRAQPRVAACATNPPPNRKVTVVALGAVTQAATVGTAIASMNGQAVTTEGWTNILSTGYHAGNSGGGVFDPETGCLWGILSYELGGHLGENGPLVDFTAFVPASKIAPFLTESAR